MEKADPQFLAERAAATQDTGVDFVTRTLFIVGEITEQASYRALINLRILAESPDPIEVVLNSFGGDELAGYAIYDALLTVKNTVTIKGFGAVQSIAALIFQAGAVRLLSPYCRFMIHNGSIDISSDMDANQLVAFGKDIERGNGLYQKILAARSGQTLTTVRDLCEAETHFDPDEAVAMGFADEVLTRRKNS